MADGSLTLSVMTVIEQNAREDRKDLGEAVVVKFVEGDTLLFDFWNQNYSMYTLRYLPRLENLESAECIPFDDLGKPLKQLPHLQFFVSQDLLGTRPSSWFLLSEACFRNNSEDIAECSHYVELVKACAQHQQEPEFFREALSRVEKFKHASPRLLSAIKAVVQSHAERKKIKQDSPTD